MLDEWEIDHKISADNILKYFIFSRKHTDISCKLSQTFYMKCLILFSVKTRKILSIFSSPVRSTRRAIVVTPVATFAFAFAFAFAFPFPSHCVKFFKCLYLNSHSSQRHQIWNLGTLEGLLRFQENKPLGSCPWVGLGVRI